MEKETMTNKNNRYLFNVKRFNKIAKPKNDIRRKNSTKIYEKKTHVLFMSILHTNIGKEPCPKGNKLKQL